VASSKRSRKGSRRTAGGRRSARDHAPGAAEPQSVELPPAAPPDPEPTPFWKHPLVRVGVYAWALLGVAGVLIGLAIIFGELRLVVVPLILALFPAALLSPVQRWLVKRRLPPAIAALVVVLGSLGVIAGGVTLLAPAIAAEAPDIAVSIQEGITQLQEFLEAGPFGIDPMVVTDLLETGREQLIGLGQQAAGTVATAVAEGVAGLLFGLVALFFYLKDGARIASWLAGLFPGVLQQDAEAIGSRAWLTIGSYFRGQLLVALVDAIFIGLGLVVLGVPLALPLAVLVFVGGLFPIVGAFISGTVAVLVALADGGITIALAVLAIVVAVQQIESNVLAPVVLGKATALHPLAVIVALTIGGITLGVLGAFLAVPVAASLARGIGHLRARKRVLHGPISRAAPASGEGR